MHITLTFSLLIAFSAVFAESRDDELLINIQKENLYKKAIQTTLVKNSSLLENDLEIRDPEIVARCYETMNFDRYIFEYFDTGYTRLRPKSAGFTQAEISCKGRE